MRRAAVNAGRGALMGLADLVPGVSGGTVALVLGIHPRLVKAIAAFDLKVPGNLWRAAAGDEDSRAALARLDLPFIAPLALGLGLAILAGARGVHAALEAWPQAMMALFVGLLLGSAPLAWGRIQQVRPASWVLAGIGALVTGALAFLPQTQLPENGVAMFVAGFIAVTAMLLPGISGSGLLVILGAYATMLAAVAALAWGILLPFALGAVAGLAVASRVLRWLFRTRADATFAVLTGLLLGSVVRVWPWRDAPGFAEGVPALPPAAWASAGMVVLAVLAGAAVWGLEWSARGHDAKDE